MDHLTEQELNAKIHNFLKDRSKVHPNLGLLGKDDLSKKKSLWRVFNRRQSYKVSQAHQKLLAH